MIETIKTVGVDKITFGVAVLCVLLRIVQSIVKKRQISTTDCVMSLLNGAALFPFVLMVMAAFYSEVLDFAASSTLSVSLAGAVGFLFVFGEVISPQSLKNAGRVSQAKVLPNHQAEYSREPIAANDCEGEILNSVSDFAEEIGKDGWQDIAKLKNSQLIPKKYDTQLLASCRSKLGRNLNDNEKEKARAVLREQCKQKLQAKVMMTSNKAL